MAFTNLSGRTQPSLAEINVTPFVDVVLVLLIIFMITAPVIQSGVDVNVPKTKTVKEVTEARTVISIDRQQRVYIDNSAVNVNEIPAKLKQMTQGVDQPSIYLRADENVPFGAFATVMDMVKQAGITNVSIVTEPLQTGGKVGALR
jgi:biopolymer transport protein ExbD/biopolymer transport protein TolR